MYIPNKKFIKNIIELDVDASRGINTYTIKSMFEITDEEGYTTTKYHILNKHEYSWNSIEISGGPAKLNEELKKKYNADFE